MSRSYNPNTGPFAILFLQGLHYAYATVPCQRARYQTQLQKHTREREK